MVSIEGLNTHFVQGTTTASFGAGITVGALTVNSTTSAMAVVNIDPAAATGARSVTLTTGAEVVTLAGGFTVTAGTPTITLVNPNSGQQGQQNLSVAITGLYTHFAQGTTQVNLGAGITVSSIAVNTPTSVTATLSIDSAASLGAHSVTVTTGAEVVTLVNAFTVTATTLVPNILGLPPDSANAAIVAANLSPGVVTTLNQPITLNFNQLPSSQGFTYKVIGRGPVPESQVFSISGGVLDINTIGIGFCGSGGIAYWWKGIGDLLSPFSLSFTARVLQEQGNTTAQPFGFYVQVDTGREFLGFGFGKSLIKAGDGKVTSAVDNTVFHNYRIEGQPGLAYQLYVDDVLVLAGTPAYSADNISYYASVGLYGGNVSFGNGTCGTNAYAQMTAFSFQQAQGFVTQQAPPQGTRVPDSSTVDYTALFAPNGRPFVSAGPDQAVSFGQAASLAGQVLDDGRPVGWPLTIGWSTVAGPGSVTFANASAAATTATFTTPGVYVLRLTANDGQYPNYADATVTVTPTAGTPQLISLSPVSAQRGSTLTVTIIGQSTHFSQGATSVTFDSSVTVNSVTVSSPTQLTANVSVNSVAISGTRTVVVTTGPENVALTGVLSIGNGTPVVSAVTPNAGQQGQTLTVSISGTFTDFIPGVTTATFGAGITITSLTVNSPTSATAVLNIDPSATPGARDVTVTTGAEVAALANGFTVQPGTPVITLVNPNTGQQGQQNLSVNITGQFTHFVQGATTASFGAGVTLASLTVNSGTTATAVINIDSAATLGPRTVTVTTGTEAVSVVNGFTINAAVVNHAPVVSAGAPQTITWPNSTALQGVVTDDGLPIGGTLTSAWSQFSVAPSLPLTWFQPYPTGVPPSGRYCGNVAYNPASNRLILFGGYVYIPPANVNGHPTDVWTLSNANRLGNAPSTWTQLIAPNPPGTISERVCSGAGYDTINNRLIVFGGEPLPSTTLLNDVWVLANADGTTGAPQWIQLNPVGTPPSGRFFNTNSVFYDQINNRLILFGGDSPSVPCCSTLNDVWILTNANGLTGTPAWTQLIPVGAAPQAYGPAGYDPVTNRLVAFTTSSQTLQAQNEIWVLSNANGLGGPPQWVQSTPSPMPPTRFYSTAVYDSTSNQFLLYGGCDNQCTFGNSDQTLGDLWVLANANGTGGLPTWTQLSPTNIAAGRRLAAAIYDTTNNRLTLFGGQLAPSTTAINETWVLNWAMPRSSVTTFGNPALPVTTASFGSPGIYTLQLSASDSQLSSVSETTVTVTPANGPPSVVAGAPLALATPGTVELSGQASDDGLPLSSTLITTWSLVSGPGAVAFSNPSTASTNATFPSLGSYVLALTATDSQLSATSYVTVLVGTAPALLSSVPSVALQGQTNLALAITGQGTHFVQGTSQVSFGSDITVNSVSVTSLTSLTANITIPVAATLGPHSLTVTTGTEIVSLSNALTVSSPVGAPTITVISPASGQQGQGGPVGIVGQYTHFLQGATQVDFGSGIIVSNVSVSCPTCLTAQLSVAATAPVGPHDVTVTTGSEVVKLTGGFTVTAGTPILTSMVPAGGNQGQSVTSTITGQFTHWAQGSTQVSLGTGITVTSVTVSNATSLSVQLSIDPAAAVGTRALTVTTGTEVVSAANVFNVQAATPILYTLNPGGGSQGQQNLSVIITGLATHFVQGTSVATFGAGVTVASLTVASATSATAVVNIDPAAVPGTRTVTVTTGSEAALFTNGFTVTTSGPIIYTLDPGGSSQGAANLQVQITGLNTHFVQGTSVATFGAGITVTSLAVTNATTATATINIDAAAALGPRTVTVTTGTEVASFANGFTVVAGVPGITQIIPGGGPQGIQNLSLAVTAQFTHFVQGTTTATLGAGITVNSVTITDSTHLAVSISVSATAATGSRTVTVTTGTEVVSAPGGFVVSAAGTPTIVSVVPTSATQGQQNLNVTITGLLTNFVQGTSAVSFGGAGITVNSVTVASATSLTANISVALGAPTGSRTVTVTTGSEIASLANAFIVQLAVNQAPVITIAPAWSVTLPNQLTLNYTVTDDGLPLGGTLTVTWSTVSGPGNVGFQNQTPTSISVGFDQAGTYTLQISASDTQLTTTQNVTVTVTGNPIPPPTVTIASPTEGTEVTAPMDVVGTVTSTALASWSLEMRMQEESVFRPFATGTTQITNGTLGTFDPTLLLNGIALIQLRATDTAGQTSIAGPVSVVLTKNLKIGNFTVSFNDLSVPVAGLPIQVVRTYDSRNKIIGDFGVGWTLDLKTVQLSTNGALGDNWTETSTGGAFPNYCIQAVKAHVVTVSFNDGTTYEFQPALNPSCQQFVPIQDQNVAMTFTPTGITPPNATLAFLGGVQPYVTGSVPGPVSLVELDGVTMFDPDQYLLTLPDGRVLQISRASGLQIMTDPNGNTLTVTSSGITHSSGKSVTFQRDISGRITQITDPAGNPTVYTYDLNGNLASVTDRVNNTTTFTYDGNHGLLTILDPRGVQPIKNVYDDSGRLIQHIDAFGNTINYTHDINTHQEEVTDRLGNLTVNEYDTDGNIVKVTDALGGITTRTYDSRDNVLSETNPLGKTRVYTYDSNNNRLTEMDPLNHATSYTYNSRNQVLTVVDPLGHTTTNAYDASGNLTSTKDAASQTTSYSYNALGLRTSMTDAMGNLTQYQYDASGNLTQQTDALGHITAYTYDVNGNKLTETKSRTTTSGPETLITTYQYDKLNRLVKTTYPDASTTQIAYNNIGKQSVTTDPLARQTSYQYDLMGRLTQTTFPDGTNESSTYDAEGDRLTSVDRGGRTTSYSYDALKRMFKTTFADGAVASTAYDAAGQVSQVNDPRGNATKYVYDDAGRRIQVTDALNHSSSFAYDAGGNQTSMTDANGNQTLYQYDALNRRTRVTYPDNTFDSTAYDALGRALSKTDQAGKTTQFQYDVLGRLTQVTDAASQLTSYAFDEVGSRISQTDAKGHTTTFAYDKLGRRTKRTLPLGMSETSAYNAAGNMVGKTDFNGKTTTYAYDSANRLLTKVPDASLAEPTVTFTYSATGQRASMVDASGNTTYAYDLRDRLLTKATPQGTLTYNWDAAGNLLTIRSSNTGGTSVNYAYDALNRLSTATDNRLASGVTTYTRDAAGNLSSYLYPNGVQHTYTYNTLNRLTNLAVGQGVTAQASYAYTLGPSGNRTAVTELGGRQVNYTYDMLYRLTGETIVGGGFNGAIGYTYDPVGNRLTRTSTVAPVPAATYAYDNNDRLATDTYDVDGNTIASAANTYAYDFENHLKSMNGAAVTITSDGDGNRVVKTAGGTTTQYLVDDRNLTGYAQVLEEVSSGVAQRVYTYGLNRISQSQASGTSFYGYDGHGNVRLLTDTTGAVTDSYDYDAFGNIISKAGSTPNLYLYSGEQNDPNLGFYYLRARYLDPGSARFKSADTFEGNPYDPGTLHRYLYVHGSPVNLSDPTGLLTLQDEILTVSIMATLESIAVIHIATNRLEQQGGKFAGVFASLRTGVDLTGTGFSAGFDIAYDFAGGRTCAIPTVELGISATRGSGLGASGGLGLYTGETACDGHLALGSTVNIPLNFYKLGSVIAAPLAPQLPFSGLLTRLANAANSSALSVSIGTARNAASFALTYNGGLSITATLAGQPYPLDSELTALRGLFGTAVDSVLGTLRTVAAWGPNFTDIDAHAGNFTSLVPQF